MEKIRKQHRQKAAGTGSSQPGQDPSKMGTDKRSDDDCRCKEVSKKTSTEMLRLMLNDLAFWKKGKKRK